MILTINYNGTLRQFDIAQMSDISNIVADEYSATSTYAVGDYVLYNGTLYECTTAIQSGEEWASAHWNAITIIDEIESLSSEVDAKYTKPSGGIPDTDIASASTWNSKYTKPSGGIPASDLASGVIPSQEIFVGSTTPSGYTIYIDPDGGIPYAQGVNF